jgi:hypothetical protein
MNKKEGIPKGVSRMVRSLETDEKTELHLEQINLWGRMIPIFR